MTKFQIWSDDDKGRPHLLCTIEDDPCAVDYIYRALVNTYPYWHIWTEMKRGREQWKKTCEHYKRVDNKEEI